MSGRYSVIPQEMQAAVAKANEKLTVTDRLIAWCAVHGSLQFALRHPDFPASTRQLIGPFIEQLGEALVKEGFFTADTLRESVELEKRFHARKITQGD